MNKSSSGKHIGLALIVFAAIFPAATEVSGIRDAIVEVDSFHSRNGACSATSEPSSRVPHRSSWEYPISALTSMIRTDPISNAFLQMSLSSHFVAVPSYVAHGPEEFFVGAGGRSAILSTWSVCP